MDDITIYVVNKLEWIAYWANRGDRYLHHIEAIDLITKTSASPQLRRQYWDYYLQVKYMGEEKPEYLE